MIVMEVVVDDAGRRTQDAAAERFRSHPPNDGNDYCNSQCRRTTTGNHLCPLVVGSPIGTTTNPKPELMG
jgi:hypothetical protein